MIGAVPVPQVRTRIKELWARAPSFGQNISVNHLWKNPPYIGRG
jgi:hypothetical protein